MNLRNLILGTHGLDTWTEKNEVKIKEVQKDMSFN